MLLTPVRHAGTRYVRVMLGTAEGAHRDQWRIRNGEPPRRFHPAYVNRSPFASFAPVKYSRADLKALDALAVETLTDYRRLWAHGVQLPTVEDLAPADAVKVCTVLGDRVRVESTPHRPEDLNPLPPTALPRGGDPVPVARSRGVCGHHYARTSPGGAPT